MVGIYILVIILIPIVGAFVLKQAKARSFKRLEAEAQGKAVERLNGVVQELGGKIVDGPALEAPRGRLELYASKAPKETVIDVTKFSAPVPGDLQLVVMRSEDAAKVAVKGLQPVPLADPAYKAFSSNVDLAGRLFNPKVLTQFVAMEAATRGRVRLRLVNGTLTFTLTRGLAKADELRDFFNGCADLVDALKAS
jgi:hypothetical protein